MLLSCSCCMVSSQRSALKAYALLLKDCHGHKCTFRTATDCVQRPCHAFTQALKGTCPGYVCRPGFLQIGLRDCARGLHVRFSVYDNCRYSTITGFIFAGVPSDALNGAQHNHDIPDRWLCEEEDSHSQEDKPNQAHDIGSSCDWIERERAKVQGRDSGHGHRQQRPQGHTSSTTCDKGCIHTHACQLSYKSDGSREAAACYYTQSCGHDTSSNAGNAECRRRHETLNHKCIHDVATTPSYGTQLTCTGFCSCCLPDKVCNVAPVHCPCRSCSRCSSCCSSILPRAS